MSNYKAIKILYTQQMRWLDAEIIKREPISSIDLMERAAIAIFK
jgi:NAD(P)H-hydrate repair Nnr-like enzyme with NAD(P)H-hydrate epimerase domain